MNFIFKYLFSPVGRVRGTTKEYKEAERPCEPLSSHVAGFDKNDTRRCMFPCNNNDSKNQWQCQVCHDTSGSVTPVSSVS